MQEEYIQVNLAVARDDYDTAIAVLSEIDYYAFEEDPAVLKAFVLRKDFDDARLEDTLALYFPAQKIAKEIEVIEAKDWNAEWEKNFHSVAVRDFCEVHPPHRAADPNMKYHVMVAPKMAFGTGHHATTWLVIDHCESLDFEGKRVLDMGCGTGVLGLLAKMLGAKEVTCIDFDPWSVENTRENAQLNQIEGIEVLLGDAEVIPSTCYDILLANINRNVLMADRDRYIAAMAPGGTLVISGFYDFDEAKLLAHFGQAGLRHVARKEKDQWVMLAFEKPSNLEGTK